MRFFTNKKNQLCARSSSTHACLFLQFQTFLHNCNNKNNYKCFSIIAIAKSITITQNHSQAHKNPSPYTYLEKKVKKIWRLALCAALPGLARPHRSPGPRWAAARRSWLRRPRRGLVAPPQVHTARGEAKAQRIQVHTSIYTSKKISLRVKFWC